MHDRFRLADPDAPFIERYLQQFESGHEVDSVMGALVSNASWMVGNTILALIPFFLARLLFVRGIGRRWLWAVTAAAFVAFLPNALYVVTDLIHLAAEGAQLGWSAGSIFVLVPIYALFVAVGITSYSACLMLSYRWLLRRVSVGLAWFYCALLHAACACGVYLGRVVRLNSWEFVTAPASVLDGVRIMLTRPEALAYVATLALVGAVLIVLARPLARRLLKRRAWLASPRPA